jgi:hypothetical protein
MNDRLGRLHPPDEVRGQPEAPSALGEGIFHRIKGPDQLSAFDQDEPARVLAQPFIEMLVIVVPLFFQHRRGSRLGQFLTS